MSDKFVQVEGHPDLSRDMDTGAIVNRNRSAYDRAKKRAKEAQKSRSTRIKRLLEFEILSERT